MRLRFWILVCGCLLILGLGVAGAAEGIIYDFDRVDVLHAAEFTAYPTGVSADNWLAELAGGSDQPVQVLLGVVRLQRDGQTVVNEEFLRLSGPGGQVRLLVNSATYSDPVGPDLSSQVSSFFWSAKRLEGNSVVKDFTPPIRSLALYRQTNPASEYRAIILRPANDGVVGAREWQEPVPKEGIYTADLETLYYAGDPSASIGQE